MLKMRTPYYYWQAVSCNLIAQKHELWMWFKCNMYTICRQTQLNTRWYANLLNVNLNNYIFRPQSLAIIRLYKRKFIN